VWLCIVLLDKDGFLEEESDHLDRIVGNNFSIKNAIVISFVTDKIGFVSNVPPI
jgi:hypothetical protein